MLWSHIFFTLFLPCSLPNPMQENFTIVFFFFFSPFYLSQSFSNIKQALALLSLFLLLFYKTVFKFNPKKDSVLRVTEKTFNSYNTSKPIERYRNEKTLIELDQCEPFYFISGTEGHCEKGQELLANVAYDRRDVELLTGAPVVAPTPDRQGNDAIRSMKVGFAVVIGSLAGLLVIWEGELWKQHGSLEVWFLVLFCCCWRCSVFIFHFCRNFRGLISVYGEFELYCMHVILGIFTYYII